MLAESEPSFFADPKRLIQTGVAVVLLLVAIYVLVPKLFDLQDAWGKVKEGDPLWIAAGVAFCVAMFAAYVALFRGVVGEKVIHLEWAESYQITMAGLAATRLFSAGGAGGILLTYWALRKAGMERRQAVCRMVAFLVVLYSVYLLAIVVFGVLLRTGVLSGEAPLSGTVIPAALAALALVIGLLMALLPNDFERRIERHTSGRFGKIARRLATVPATFAQGTRTAIAFVRHPSSGAMAFGGAIGFWGANIAILWASFHAFDVSVPLGVVVQGFFLGMVANLIPVRAGRCGGGRRRHDRGLRPLRRPELGGVPRRAHLSRDRLLAADPARDRRLLPAPQAPSTAGSGRAGSARSGSGWGSRKRLLPGRNEPAPGATIKSEVRSLHPRPG